MTSCNKDAYNVNFTEQEGSHYYICVYVCIMGRAITLAKFCMT